MAKTKNDIVAAVVEKAGLSKKQAAAAVDAVLETIRDALAEGEKVNLIGFGSFSVKERKAREGRNPQTGEKIKIPAKKVPAFKPGKQLREAVQG
jgi:DNA-binding protein HU-beta